MTANIDRHIFMDSIARTGNVVLAVNGLNGFVSTEVKNSTSVLLLNFSAKNPAHHQYVNR
jgi:hypothetical protein